MLNENKPTRYPTVFRRMATKGFLLTVAGLILVGWLIWHFFIRDAAPGAGAAGFPGARNGRGATSVGIATAEKTDIPVIMNALGTVTATATATVRPQVSGVLQEVHYREGQMVKAGQLLATIDPRQFELALLQASGQRQRDEAQLENARLVLKRDLVLQGQDSIAQQDVEAQSALVKQLEGTVMTDRAAEGNAKLNLSYTKVIAPVSGRVGLRAVDVGNVVSTSDTNGIAVITQLAPIDVEFSVPQIQAAQIQTDIGFHQEEELTAANKDALSKDALKVTALDRERTTTLAEGQFLALDNQVDVQTGTVRAKARFANETRHLFPNQFVNVKLVLHTIKDAVVIPVSALRHGDNGDFVYVLNSETKTVSLRPVTSGQSDVDKVQITTGLQLGEKVITEGADRLKDGATVNLPGEHPEAAGADKRSGQNKDGTKKDWSKKDSTSGDASSGSSSSHAGERRRRRTEAE